MIWDGIRAVDYLLTRKEVDPARIGITGRSGGGTQSSQIAAFDPRIYAAAPENFITTYTRLLQTRGIQDAEQFLPGEIAAGLDQPDLMIVRAPKPALMITTTNDMFSIQGSLEAKEEIKRAYQAWGKPGNFQRVEDLEGHTSTKKNRESLYAFFQQHLQLPGDSTDQEVEFLTAEELTVTPQGQLLETSETLYSLNLKESQQLIEQLENSRQTEGHLQGVSEAARELSGFEPAASQRVPVLAGRLGFSNFQIEQYLLTNENDYPLPFYLIKPEKPNGRSLLWLDPVGKDVAFADSARFEKLAAAGFTILIPDLPGAGELGPVTFRGNSFLNGISYNEWFAADLTGNSLVGIRVQDLVQCLDFLENQKGMNEVTGISVGNFSAELLHLATFDSRVSSLALLDPLLTYRNLVQEQYYDPSETLHLVAGALQHYDLPDLMALQAPKKMLIGQIPGNEKIGSEIVEYLERTFTLLDKPDHLSLAGIPENRWLPVLLDWLDN
jgi:dienelactone hydrolase